MDKVKAHGPFETVSPSDNIFGDSYGLSPRSGEQGTHIEARNGLDIAAKNSNYGSTDSQSRHYIRERESASGQQAVVIASGAIRSHHTSNEGISQGRAFSTTSSNAHNGRASEIRNREQDRLERKKFGSAETARQESSPHPVLIADANSNLKDTPTAPQRPIYQSSPVLEKRAETAVVTAATSTARNREEPHTVPMAPAHGPEAEFRNNSHNEKATNTNSHPRYGSAEDRSSRSPTIDSDGSKATVEGTQVHSARGNTGNSDESIMKAPANQGSKGLTTGGGATISGESRNIAAERSNGKAAGCDPASSIESGKGLTEGTKAPAVRGDAGSCDVKRTAEKQLRPEVLNLGVAPSDNLTDHAQQTSIATAGEAVRTPKAHACVAHQGESKDEAGRSQRWDDAASWKSSDNFAGKTDRVEIAESANSSGHISGADMQDIHGAGKLDIHSSAYTHEPVPVGPDRDHAIKTHGPLSGSSDGGVPVITIDQSNPSTKNIRHFPDRVGALQAILDNKLDATLAAKLSVESTRRQFTDMLTDVDSGTITRRLNQADRRKLEEALVAIGTDRLATLKNILTQTPGRMPPRLDGVFDMQTQEHIKTLMNILLGSRKGQKDGHENAEQKPPKTSVVVSPMEGSRGEFVSTRLQTVPTKAQ